MATYGYARCSTNESRQDISRQKRELEEMGAEIVFTEYASGAKADREQLNKLLEKTQAGDTICALEVSRLTRSTKHLCDIIETCKKKRLCLVIKNSITVDCRNGQLDPMTAAFLQVAGVFAELERNIISERVKSGIDNRKSKGLPTGRTKTTLEDIPAKFLRYFEQYQAGTITISELSRLAEVSRPTAYKYAKLLRRN